MCSAVKDHQLTLINQTMKTVNNKTCKSALAIVSIFILLLTASAQAQQTEPTARWNAAQYGVKPSETEDQTDALQALLDRAGQAGGGTVELASGRYRINGNLSIPGGVTLKGTYSVPPTVNRKDDNLKGTVLLAFAGKGDPDGKPFIFLAGDNAVIAGVIIIYPEWDRNVVPPVPYPPCIASRHTNNVGVLDCCLLNPYEGIRMVQAHRHLLRNITGYPIWRGLLVDQCYDIGRVENFHYWPFGLNYNPKDPYCEWINKNGVAFEFARTDWEYVCNTFCFGYGVGYKFSEYRHGSANGNFLGLGADSCRRAVLVEQSQEPGLLITNGEFVGRWTSQDSVCIEVAEGNRGKVSLNNCSFWGPVETCIRSNSIKGQLTANACHFVNWDNGGTGASAIKITAGKAIISNSTFQQPGTHVEVLPTAKSVIITGNQAEGGLNVEGANLPQTVMSANELNRLDRMTAAERVSYTIDLGTSDDAVFIRNWHGPELFVNAQKETISSRWSKRESKVSLPIVAGKAYQLTVQLRANPYRNADASTAAGLWLEDKQVASLSQKETALARPDDTGAITIQIPAQEKVRLTLVFRTPGWVPAEVHQRSNDYRTLGVQVDKIEMKAQ